MALSFNKSTIAVPSCAWPIAQANPNDFLIGLITGNFEITTKADATVLTSTTTGGSSANWVLPPGMSRFDIMEIAEMAYGS